MTHFEAKGAKTLHPRLNRKEDPALYLTGKPSTYETFLARLVLDRSDEYKGNLHKQRVQSGGQESKAYEAKGIEGYKAKGAKHRIQSEGTK